MKVSYNWLKQLVKVNLPVEKVSEILTDCGLEVEGIEKFESIPGGLEGFVIGKVVEKEKHPDADKLSLTKVDIGREQLLDIVCGAPNVAAGQTVVVATVGTMIYSENGNFEIKKSKIRGAVSEGMICAEDELNIGKSHDGIMVLSNDIEIGTLAKDYFKIESDFVIEIGLTPNRSDATSHYGVARDLAAAIKSLNFNSSDSDLDCILPDITSFKVDNTNLPISIEIEDIAACPRYSGLTVSGITVKESPEWLKNRLKAIGQKPINNIVDITNYVLHELGQPLHAFDAAEITGNKVIVKKQKAGTKFITLDNIERELTENDLMICNVNEAMCMAGVFGGVKSGVSEHTKNIFIESAYFNPVTIRKTSKHHGLKTDASFRFERGADPNATIYALKRAALLIKEVAGGTISSEIVDVYSSKGGNYPVDLNLDFMDTFIGHKIDRSHIKSILKSLEIVVKEEKESVLKLEVPTYRVDVLREVDVIEEILRIYGFNNIPMPEGLKSSISYQLKPNVEKIKNMVSEQLTSIGFYEIMNNSLTAASYSELIGEAFAEKNVRILNPLSKELDVMRQSLLFGGLESISHNINRRRADLKLYEFGKVYSLRDSTAENVVKKYQEQLHLGIWLTGNLQSENWNNAEKKADVFFMKTILNEILKKIGISNYSLTENTKDEMFAFSASILVQNNREIGRFGLVSNQLLKKFDIKQEVYFADFNWDEIIKVITKHKVLYKEISKFPEVRRDLALLVDKTVKFSQIEEIAKKNEKKLLKAVNLFDVYEGEKLPEGKKSYAISFILLDEQQTLTDKVIDKVMERFIDLYQKELGAQIR
ncbi:MAG: phenylalanine--tRNA ligase subunit beta [Bacteroidota bacterium]